MTLKSHPLINLLNRWHASRTSRHDPVQRSSRSVNAPPSLLIRPFLQIIQASLKPILRQGHYRNRSILNNIRRMVNGISRPNLNRLISRFTRLIPNPIAVKLLRSQPRRHNSRQPILLQSPQYRIHRRVNTTSLPTHPQRRHHCDILSATIHIKSRRLSAIRTPFRRTSRRLNPQYHQLNYSRVRASSLATPFDISHHHSRSQRIRRPTQLTSLLNRHISPRVPMQTHVRQTIARLHSLTIRLNHRPQRLQLQRAISPRHLNRVVSPPHQRPLSMTLNRSHNRNLLDSTTINRRPIQMMITLPRLQSHRVSHTSPHIPLPIPVAIAQIRPLIDPLTMHHRTHHQHLHQRRRIHRHTRRHPDRVHITILTNRVITRPYNEISDNESDRHSLLR